MALRARAALLGFLVLLVSALPAVAAQFDWDHFPSCASLSEELLTENIRIIRVYNDQRKRVVQEVRIADLVPIHSIPRLTVPKPDTHVQDLMTKLRQNGYWLSHAISVIRMPDGQLFIGGGHHRVAAMKRMGQATIPAQIYNWTDLDSMTRRWYIQEVPEAFVGFTDHD